MNIVKITFDNGANLPVDLVLQTDKKDAKELNELATKISEVLLAANKGESLEGFKIPDNWYSYGFIDKLELVASHLSIFIGGFTVLQYISMTKRMGV